MKILRGMVTDAINDPMIDLDELIEASYMVKFTSSTDRPARAFRQYITLAHEAVSDNHRRFWLNSALDLAN
mgnify:CR=1 FL=1